MYYFPINPIDFDGGSILFVPGGRSVIRLDPVPEDAPDAVREHMNLYTATLAEMGHTVVVGDQGAMALAATAMLDEARDEL